jgi:hypothetical protein
MMPLLLLVLLQVHALQVDVTDKAAMTDALVQVSSTSAIAEARWHASPAEPFSLHV